MIVAQSSLNFAVHVVTWLARTITNAGVAPNTPASIAIPELEARTGGASFDPVIAEYWE
jgi:hypothetical protein